MTLLQACITSFLDSVLKGRKEISDLPIKKTLPGLCRNSVLITENELHALVSVRIKLYYVQFTSLPRGRLHLTGVPFSGWLTYIKGRDFMSQSTEKGRKNCHLDNVKEPFKIL